MEDYRCRLIWKKGEDVKKWILRVETYAAARGWNENKMATMASIGLPDDKVEFLLTVPGGGGGSKRLAQVEKSNPC